MDVARTFLYYAVLATVYTVCTFANPARWARVDGSAGSDLGEYGYIRYQIRMEPMVSIVTEQ